MKWNPFDATVVKPALILAYSYPIPEEIRSNVWFVVSGGLDLIRKNRNVYSHLTQLDSKSADVIEKDLKRTFVGKVANEKWEKIMRRILIAFSNFNPEIGYTQGMNYIVGFLLRQYFENTPYLKLSDDDGHEADDYEVVSSKKAVEAKLLLFTDNSKELVEEKTFWTFVSIMNKTGTLFSDKLPGFHKSVQCFKGILEYHAPTELVHHLNELNVYPIMLSGWYHSLFTYPSMNVNIAKRIWDVFLVELMDFSILLKISYLMVIRHEKALCKMDFVHIIEFSKSEKCFVFNNQDDHDLIYRAFKLNLHESYLAPIRNLKYVDIKHRSPSVEDAAKSEKANKRRYHKEKRNKTAQHERESTPPKFHFPFQSKADAPANERKHANRATADSTHSSSSPSPSSSSFIKLKSADSDRLTTTVLEPMETTDPSNAEDEASNTKSTDSTASWASIFTFGYAK